MSSQDQSAPIAKSDPLAGKVMNNYRLIDRLGAGGMGLVYRAEQISIKREVAVKLLPFRLINDELNVKRIEREATAMGNLRHPNIATIFDFGFSEEGQAYLVMELIRGQTLRDLIQTVGALSPARAATIFAQVADAMDYAHAHGIIHRDLKPDNIMLDCEHKEDFVKILDFGIAKNTAGDSMSLTQAGTVVGSPLYMSPEQCMGLMLTGKTDIYSLGVIMYEALTGEAPYKGASSYDTIRKKTTEQPPRFPEKFSQLKELEELTLKCLALRSADRPESMGLIKPVLVKVAGVSTTDVILQPSGQTPTFAKTVTTPGSISGSALGRSAQNRTPSQPAPAKETKFWEEYENTQSSRISGETLTGSAREDTADDVDSGVFSPAELRNVSGQEAPESHTATMPVSDLTLRETSKTTTENSAATAPMTPPALPSPGRFSISEMTPERIKKLLLIKERKLWYAIGGCAMIMSSVAVLLFVMLTSQPASDKKDSTSAVQSLRRSEAISADDLMGHEDENPIVPPPVTAPAQMAAPAPSPAPSIASPASTGRRPALDRSAPRTAPATQDKQTKPKAARKTKSKRRIDNRHPQPKKDQGKIRGSIKRFIRHLRNGSF